MVTLTRIEWIEEESDELNLDEVVLIRVGIRSATARCACGAVHRLAEGRGLEQSLGMAQVTCPTCGDVSPVDLAKL